MLRNLTHQQLMGLDPDRLWVFKVENEEQGANLLRTLQDLEEKHPRLEKLAGVIVPKNLEVIQTNPDELTIIRATSDLACEKINEIIEQVAARNIRFDPSTVVVIPDALIEQAKPEWLEGYIRSLQELLKERKAQS